MAGKFCGYNGCRRVVRDGETRCWQHKGLVEDHSADASPVTFSDLKDRAVRWRKATRNSRFMRKLFSPPESLGNDGAIFIRNNAYTPIDVSPETVSTIYDVADKIGPRSTRDELNATISSGGVMRFIESLEQAMPGRVSRVELEGLSLEGGTRKIDAPDYKYMVACVDYGEDSEIVVDPFVRALIPESKKSANGDSEDIIDLASALRDDVFIGTMNEYFEQELEWQKKKVASRESTAPTGL